MIFDKSGKPIMVGAYIVYGHALGRSAGLRFGKVLAIREKGPSHYPSSLDSLASIRVIGVDDDWNTNEPKLCSRTGTLQFPNRLLVLEAEDLPETHRQLLDGYKAPEKEKRSAWERL